MYLKLNFKGNNLINGQLPSEFGELESLEILIIQNNTLTGSIPTQIGSMNHLKSLDLGKMIIQLLFILWCVCEHFL